MLVIASGRIICAALGHETAFAADENWREPVLWAVTSTIAGESGERDETSLRNVYPEGL